MLGLCYSSPLMLSLRASLLLDSYKSCFWVAGHCAAFILPLFLCCLPLGKSSAAVYCCSSAFRNFSQHTIVIVRELPTLSEAVRHSRRRPCSSGLMARISHVKPLPLSSCNLFIIFAEAGITQRFLFIDAMMMSYRSL